METQGFADAEVEKQDEFGRKLTAEQKEKYTTWRGEFVSLLDQARKLAGDGKISEAWQCLLPVEKKARNAAFDASELCLQVALKVVALCVDAKDWEQVIASITLLCKRRGVLRKVAQGVIRAGVAALEANVSSLSKDQRVSLIQCLRAVSKGKIFVELEHARLTLQLAHIREREDKDIMKASELLSEVTVETIGAMDRFEKVAITLEQARLLLLAGDTIKAAIVGNKIK